METRIKNIILALCAIGWLFTWIRLSSSNRDLYDQLVTQGGQMSEYKDQLGRQTASTNILLASNRDLKDLAVHYQSMYQMQKIKPAKVVYIKGDLVYTQDTILMPTQLQYRDSMPVYTATDSARWHRFFVQAAPDTTIVQYTIKNEYITWHQRSSRWYEPDRYTVHTLNINPNTQTKETTAHQIRARRKYRMAWLCLGLIGGIYIAK